MPICPRCGKSLSSEQALAYHLNRKFKCGTWKCLKCSKIFDTKFDLNIHEMNCIDERIDCPSYDILRIFYKHLNLSMVELDDFNKIKSVNPFFLKNFDKEYIGKLYDATYDCQDNNVNVRNGLKFISKHVSDANNNLVIEYIKI